MILQTIPDTARRSVPTLRSQAGFRARERGEHPPAHRLPAAAPGKTGRWPQWHIDAPALAYRCGGSTGIVTS
jgi:hypothetical protein